MGHRPDLKTLPDEQLLRGLLDVLRQSRHDEARLVAHIAEVDARELYAREASASMFAWCTEVLHLSEAEAYLRIGAARASRRHPVLLDMLADGRIHLSGIERLAPHLTDGNRDVLRKRAAHKTKRQIEELVAEVVPRPADATRLRKLPARRGPEGVGGGMRCSELRPDGAARPVAAPTMDGVPHSGGELRLDGVHASACPPDRRSGSGSELPPGGVDVDPSGRCGMSEPVGELRLDVEAALPASRAKPIRAPEVVAPARYRLQFDLDGALRDKLERLQALLRHRVPNGDLAQVIDIAVTRELERLEAKRFGRAKKPRKGLAETDTKAKSRHIPAAVRRFVDQRDGGRCTYPDKHGGRCTKRHDLEFHHIRPFGMGGDHRPEGIALMCRTHNQLLAEQEFGKEKMVRHRRRERSDGKPVANGGTVAKTAVIVSERTGPNGLRARWQSSE